MDPLTAFYLFFGYVFIVVGGACYGIFLFDERFWALRGKVRESCLRVSQLDEWERFERVVLSTPFPYILVFAAPVVAPLAHLYLRKFERRHGNVR